MKLDLLDKNKFIKNQPLNTLFKGIYLFIKYFNFFLNMANCPLIKLSNNQKAYNLCNFIKKIYVYLTKKKKFKNPRRTGDSDSRHRKSALDIYAWERFIF